MRSNNTIYNELKELNSLLANISNRNVYTVPQGYFDVVSHDILLAVQQTDIEISINNTVPEGYFDGFASSIMAKIKVDAISVDEESALLAGIKYINPYQVPASYFANLSGLIIEKILADSTDTEESILLANLQLLNPYQVPVGYFDNLSAEIMRKIPQPAKVIEMKKRSSFFNYAAAAVITGIIGLSIISVFDKKQTDNSIMPGNEATVITPNNIDKEFATLTDADIVNYLQKDRQDVNAALVASIAEDNNLPDQVDYLTDDKTLDNLLNELKPSESTNN